MRQFSRELAGLISSFSLENGSNTPDFILARYLVDSLVAFDKATHSREVFYGVKHEPVSLDDKIKAGVFTDRAMTAPQKSEAEVYQGMLDKGMVESAPQPIEQPEPGRYAALLNTLPISSSSAMRHEVVNLQEQNFNTIREAVRQALFDDNFSTEIIGITAAALMYMDAGKELYTDEDARLREKVKALREALTHDES